MIRRALVICAPSPLEVGHAPVGTVKVVRAMLDMGWQVDLIGFRWKKESASDSFFSQMLEGARVYEAVGIFGKPAGWVPKAVRIGSRLLATNRYDLLLSFAHLTWTHVVALVLKRFFDVPWVAFSSDPWSNYTLEPRSRWRRAAERRLELASYRAADALVFTCPQLQAWMIGQFSDAADFSQKSFAVPYFFDYNLFPKQRVAAEGDRICIRHVGTVPPGDYVPTFFEALRSLLDADPTLNGRLSVAFHGGHRPNPYERVRELGLEACVEFHPPVSYPNSLELMKNADALLFFGLPPAEFGGLGNATLHLKFCDYVGAAKPIFAFAAPGSPAHAALMGTAGICSSEDPALVTQTLKRFLEAQQLPAAEVRASFSRDCVVRRWEQVFEFARDRSSLES